MRSLVTYKRRLAVQMLVLGIGSTSTLAIGSRAYAGSVNWVGPSNGEWDVAGNWSGGAIPGSADDVTDNLANTSIVGDGSVQTSAPSNFNINSLTNSGGGEILGEYNSTLSISGDLNNSNNSEIINDGVYDTWATNGALYTSMTIGGNLDNNGGSIQSLNGADLYASGSMNGSTVINQNGGLIQASGINSKSKHGEIDLGGYNTSNYLSSISNESNSTIEANTGGNVNLICQNVINSSGATIESTGTGSNGFGSTVNFGTVIAPDFFNIGVTNNGLIEATAGGVVNEEVYAGFINTLTFSNNSTGTLEITDPNSTGYLFITQPFENTGTIKVLNHGTLLVGNDINQTAGLTKVDNANITVNNFNLEGGTLNGTGGTITGNVVQTGGTFNPGEDPSSFDITGNYDLSGGKLMIDIAGTTSFDQLLVGGNSSLTGGTLYLDFINGFVPVNGDSFDFLKTTGSLSGGFSSIASNLNGSYSFSNGVLTVGGAPPPVPESGSAEALLMLIAPSSLFAVRHRKGARV